MSDQGWLTLGAVSPGRLGEARREMHHAVQVLASFGQTLVEPRPDDSHRSMTWDASTRAFLSETARSDLRLALRPGGLELDVLEGGRSHASVSLVGLGMDECYAWAEAELGKAVHTPVALDRPEYEIPARTVENGALLGSGIDPLALSELERWFANASLMLERVRASESNTTPARCWPHHFDIALLILLDPDLGAADGRSVGVGLSPGDDGIDQPYWYVNAYPRPADPVLPELPSGGRWNTEGWFGAVLTGEALLSEADPGSQAGRAWAFVRAAVAAARAALERSPKG